MAQPIEAGLMDHRVTILKRSLKQLGAGENRESFDPTVTIYAQVIPMSGRDFFQASEVYQEETLRFIIRWREDIDQKDRFDFHGRQYMIVHIAELGRHEGLEVLGLVAQH